MLGQRTTIDRTNFSKTKRRLNVSESDIESSFISDETEPKFSFGKYKNEFILDIINDDFSYCTWLMNQENFKNKNPDLYKYFNDRGVSIIPNYKQYIINQRKEKKSKYFTFGKYKDRMIAEIFEIDNQYCNYIMTLENVKTYHPETIQTIEKLIKFSG